MSAQDKGRKNIQPFDGTNYLLWKKRMRMHLEQLGLLHIIDENIPDAPNNKWKSENRKVICEMAEFLDNSHLNYIGNTDPKGIRRFRRCI